VLVIGVMALWRMSLVKLVCSKRDGWWLRLFWSGSCLDTTLQRRSPHLFLQGEKRRSY
jgi:hypothetical protein